MDIKPVTMPGSTPPADFEIPGLRPPETVANPVEQQAIAQEQKQQDPVEQQKALQEAVDKLNQTSMIFDRSLRFRVHDRTRVTMVAVVDQNTERVIREFPNHEVLDMVAKMEDYLGLLFDKKA